MRRILHLAVVLAAHAANAQTPATVSELRRLSLEDLTSVSIISVSRRPQPLAEAPAAIYVLTNDDIRRTGANSLPEVLRAAPNLHVARVDAVNHAVSARGFGSSPAVANKLLVLVDGRSVYSPLFAGIFWDSQNPVLADIERIEIISGPGGTLWGANAVNGVINVLSRSAWDTQGWLVDGVAGGVDQSATARYGGQVGDSVAYRVYGSAFGRGHTVASNGQSANDGWDSWLGGARIDWRRGNDQFTLQGEAHDSDVDRGETNRGHHIIGRWTRQLTGGSSVRVRAYYDNVPRASATAKHFARTLDFDTQYISARLGDHTLVAGAGYRHTHDRFTITAPSQSFSLLPDRQDIGLANAYVQDTVALGEVSLQLGLKAEYSSYSGTDFLPAAQVSWQVDTENMLWASISRAVRTPSRIDKDINIGGVLQGGPDFTREVLTSYQAGYRGVPTPRTALSVSVYYNRYNDIRTVEFSPGNSLPLVIANGAYGHNYGLDAWGSYELTEWARVRVGVGVLEENFDLKFGRADLTNLQAVGNDPATKFSLWSQFNPWDGVEFDILLRALGKLPQPAVPSYVEADVRVGWAPTPGVEFYVAGRNLLHDRHLETQSDSTRNQLRRTVTVGVRLR